MRGFKNFKGSDARCPSIHFLFYAVDSSSAFPKEMHGLTQKSISQTFESLFVEWHAPVQFIR